MKFAGGGILERETPLDDEINPMDDITAILLEAMEQAGISGLCREGQIEFAVQEAQKYRPDVSRARLFQLAEAAARG